MVKIILSILFVLSTAVCANEARYFDGTQYMDTELSPALHPAGQFTASIWFKTNAPNTTGTLAILVGGYYYSGSWYRTWQLIITQGKIGFGYDQAVGLANTYNWSGTVGANNDSWHNSTVVFQDNVGFNLYFDGVVVVSSSGPGIVLKSAQNIPLRFGDVYYPGGAYPYTGWLDEFRLWNRVLSPSEVIYWMNHSIQGGALGMESNFSLDEIAGAVKDSTQKHTNPMTLGTTSGSGVNSLVPVK